MTESSPSASPTIAPSVHPALSGMQSIPIHDSYIDWPVTTILVCPLRTSDLAAEYLLPELSHELKTPLSGIMGLTQVMQRQGESMAMRGSQYADLLYQKSQQLLVAIHDLLDLCALSTDQFVLHLRPVEIDPILNTALQIAQRATGVKLLKHPFARKEEEAAQQWLIADSSRLEQLLTHLMNAILLHPPPDQSVTGVIQTHGPWLVLTLKISSLCWSEEELVYLGWTDYYSATTQISALPSRSDVVLQCLLAKQLSQLQGGDLSWISNTESESSVTVLLPQDLTQTTHRAQTVAPTHLLLILSQRTTELYGFVQDLMAQGELVMVARSLPEATEKLYTVSPTILAIDHQFGESCGWNELDTWINQKLAHYPCTVVWIETKPPQQTIQKWSSGTVWSWPLTTQMALSTIQQCPLKPDRTQTSSATPKQPHLSLDAFTILQLGSLPAIATEPLSFKLVSQLTQDYGCSIITVDNAEQAELFGRIWKPQIVVCIGSIPSWADNLNPTSFLHTIPCIVVPNEDKAPDLEHLKKFSIHVYRLDEKLQSQPIKHNARQFYLYIVNLISGSSDIPKESQNNLIF